MTGPKDGAAIREHDFIRVTLKGGQSGEGELLIIGPLYLVIALKSPVEENDADSIRTILKGKWMYARIDDIVEMSPVPKMWPITDDKYKGMLKTRVCRNFKSRNPAVFLET